jgi:hypothetical protein
MENIERLSNLFFDTQHLFTHLPEFENYIKSNNKTRPRLPMFAREVERVLVDPTVKENELQYLLRLHDILARL